MKGWMAALDATCAWANPGLVLVGVAAEGCSPVLAPELRDVAGRD
jgi:siroheme synthase (precorrin-2 oxidase/ferrochelatase)